MQDVTNLSAVVQRNCHVSDARYARSYSLCTYLLKMREHYRWEKGYTLTDRLPQEDVGAWVDEREQFWETLEVADFECLPLSTDCYDPFDSANINRILVPEGIVYSGGYGRFGQPHFFLARLMRTERHGQVTVYIASREYARDLTAPPAMTQGNTVYIRRDMLRRVIWQMVEEWRWKRSAGAMAQVFEHYDFDADPDGALDRITDSEVESVKLHEVGEATAGEMLGDVWNDMLAVIAGSRGELVARAVRDHLADSLTTLPALLAEGAPAPIHFYFANLKAMRRELFPEALLAYERWSDGGDLAELRALIPEARARWHAIARTMLEAYKSQAADLANIVEQMVQDPSGVLPTGQDSIPTLTSFSS